jgi:hypothetical protein
VDALPGQLVHGRLEANPPTRVADLHRLADGKLDPHALQRRADAIGAQAEAVLCVDAVLRQGFDQGVVAPVCVYPVDAALTALAPQVARNPKERALARVGDDDDVGVVPVRGPVHDSHDRRHAASLG